MRQMQKWTVSRQRFGLKHIQSSSGNHPLIQSSGESRLVHYPSTPEIEQNSAALHLTELLLSDKAAGTVIERSMDAHHIRAGEHFIERKTWIVVIMRST